MKKILFIACCLLTFSNIQSQKMITRSGEIKFEASVPAFEQIAATNNASSCLFDTTTGDIAVLALIKGFRFKTALMEEHFNENYVESSKYPKSTFKGKVLNLQYAKLNAKKSTYDVEGDLSLNGVTKKVKTKVDLSLVNGNVILVGQFNVDPKDYNIKIPSVVKNKIAEAVTVNLNFTLENK